MDRPLSKELVIIPGWRPGVTAISALIRGCVTSPLGRKCGYSQFPRWRQGSGGCSTLPEARVVSYRIDMCSRCCTRTSSYPGGNSDAGIFWRRLINLSPPHRVLIVPFADRCGVTRWIRLAEPTVLIDQSRRDWSGGTRGRGGLPESARGYFKGALTFFGYGGKP